VTDESAPHGQAEASAMSESADDGAVPATGAASMPTSQPVLIRALWLGLLSTVLLVLVCGGIGWWIAASPGLIGGVLGAVIAGLFLGLTVGSIAFANRFINHESYLILFFAIVVGGWLLKFILFIVAALLLRDQPWLEPKILFFSLIAGVLVSLVVDAFVMMKSRIPIIGNAP
jgi:membrane-bound metal-dependent hydrolase YbcI (DUF457 family)